MEDSEGEALTEGRLVGLELRDGAEDMVGLHFFEPPFPLPALPSQSFPLLLLDFFLPDLPPDFPEQDGMSEGISEGRSDGILDREGSRLTDGGEEGTALVEGAKDTDGVSEGALEDDFLLFLLPSLP
jgi:hypothetical protein